jgi:hypothetical protein
MSMKVEGSSLVGCDAMLCGSWCSKGSWSPVLQRSRVQEPWRSHVFDLECLTLVAEGTMVLWYARTNNMVSCPGWPEPSAILLWKPQIFCECDRCCLLCCNSMYSGSQVPVCLKAALHYVKRFNTFYSDTSPPNHMVLHLKMWQSSEPWLVIVWPVILLIVPV